jgi:hypothetical protein
MSIPPSEIQKSYTSSYVKALTSFAAMQLMLRDNEIPSQTVLCAALGVAPTNRLKKWLRGEEKVGMERAMRCVETWNQQEGVPRIRAIHLVWIAGRPVWEIDEEAPS